MLNSAYPYLYKEVEIWKENQTHRGMRKGVGEIGKSGIKTALCKLSIIGA